MDTQHITLYGIANCDTVKKARTWLTTQGQEAQWIDFKKHGVPHERLDAWIKALGWEPLVNTRGTTWRQLDETIRATITNAQAARALMLAQPSVIKRPLVEWPDGSISLGFDAVQWQSRLG